MEPAAIQQHWADWAETYGKALRATTKSPTAKLLELEALRRRLAGILPAGREARILEMGCGNGINCIELARIFGDARFDGVDYISQMIDAAVENARAAALGERVTFRVGDVLGVNDLADLAATYDVVFTDRCLINLNTAEAQGAGIAALAGKLAPSGHLLMIENSLDTYARQNAARVALGLEPREPASFNRFFTDAEMRSHIAAAGLELVEIEDFSGLHDLVLYALQAAANGGTVDYDHPLVTAATKVSIDLAAAGIGDFGPYGQNRLYVAKRSSR